MRTAHNWTDDSATIGIEGLKRPLRIFQVTDSHIARLDERDEGLVNDVDLKQAGWFGRSDKAFAGVMGRAEKLKPDLVMLTGDIIHFPSAASVEFFREEFHKLSVESIYTCGNHDWNYPGGAWSESMREENYHLLQDFLPEQASYQRLMLGDLQILVIDNSLYQINAEQLKFARGCLAGGAPTIMFYHVPIEIDTLVPQTIERWKQPILMGTKDFPDELRQTWRLGQDRAETFEFIELLKKSDNLAATFCGHLHFAHTDRLSEQACQYVTAAGFGGKHRLIEILPL